MHRRVRVGAAAYMSWTGAICALLRAWALLKYVQSRVACCYGPGTGAVLMFIGPSSMMQKNCAGAGVGGSACKAAVAGAGGQMTWPALQAQGRVHTGMA